MQCRHLPCRLDRLSPGISPCVGDDDRQPWVALGQAGQAVDGARAPRMDQQRLGVDLEQSKEIRHAWLADRGRRIAGVHLEPDKAGIIPIGFDLTLGQIRVAGVDRQVRIQLVPANQVLCQVTVPGDHVVHDRLR
jgi:hypothetical protein